MMRDLKTDKEGKPIDHKAWKRELLSEGTFFDTQDLVYTVEELYQAFKERFVKEMDKEENTTPTKEFLNENNKRKHKPVIRTQQKILKQAVYLFGPDKQIEMMIEECAELIDRLQKYKRGRIEKPVEEEIADVEIMIHQMKIIFDLEAIISWRDIKLNRLKRMVKKRIRNNKI